MCAPVPKHLWPCEFRAEYDVFQDECSSQARCSSWVDDVRTRAQASLALRISCRI